MEIVGRFFGIASDLKSAIWKFLDVVAEPVDVLRGFLIENADVDGLTFFKTV